jgi:hypothetical protein
MSENGNEQCPQCKEPSSPGKNFCANCGAPLDSASSRIRALIDEALKTKLKEQEYVVVETSVAAADKLTKWVKIFLFWAAIPLTLLTLLLAFLGIRTISDFTTAKKQVEGASAAAKSSIEREVASSQRAMSELGQTPARIRAEYGQLQSDMGRYQQINHKIADVQKQLTEVNATVVDLGHRTLRAETIEATGTGGPSSISWSFVSLSI